MPPPNNTLYGTKDHNTLIFSTSFSRLFFATSPDFRGGDVSIYFSGPLLTPTLAQSLHHLPDYHIHIITAILFILCSSTLHMSGYPPKVHSFSGATESHQTSWFPCLPPLLHHKKDSIRFLWSPEKWPVPLSPLSYQTATAFFFCGASVIHICWTSPFPPYLPPCRNHLLFAILVVPLKPIPFLPCNPTAL